MRFIYIILFLSFSFASYADTCFTSYNINNADSIVYCITSATCHTSCDGQIEINIVGGNEPYYFEWGSSGVAIANNFINDNLCAGNYSVTITDNNNNLVAFSSHIIEEPSELGLLKSIINPTCKGDIDGEINLITLGDGPFDWLWSNGSNSESISSLVEGEYTLRTEDIHGCFREDTFLLEDPESVESYSLADTLSCYGACDGSGIIIPTNGIPPFTFLWDNGLTNDTVTNLCYGKNYVTITDSNFCTNTDSVFIENPDSLFISNISNDSVCYNSCDGYISFDINGGNPPYKIEWIYSGISIDTLNTSLNNLCKGLYLIEVTDANECFTSQNIHLFEKDSFIINSIITNDSCFNSCNGQIEIEVLNYDISNFNFNWNNGAPNTNVINNICADTILLQLESSDLCVDTFVFSVTEPPKLALDSFFIKDNICFGESNGLVNIYPTGVSGLVEYQWTNNSGYSSTNKDIYNLQSGIYNLIIEDQNNCIYDTIFTINEPDTLLANTSIVNVSCFGYSDGIVNLNIQGGTGPYITTWNTSLSNSNQIDSLSSGNYIYSVLDANNCNTSDSVFISEPLQLQTQDSITNVFCSGDSTGSIQIQVIGGTPQYTFLWSNSSILEDLHNLSAGIYSVDITDQNGCELTKNFSISEPLFPVVLSANLTSVECYGTNTGSIDLTISGGSAPYQTQWNTADTTQDIYNLNTGTYSVTIVDNNQCFIDTSFFISENNEITISATTTDVSCNGDTTGVIELNNINGGVPPYSFMLDNGDSILPFQVPQGVYTLDVIDDNNCSNSFLFAINQPQLLSANLVVNNIDCYGYNNGEITANITGGVTPYSFIWSNGSNTQSQQNLSDGIYTVEVKDNNNCVVSDTAIITEPTEIITSFSIQDIVCANTSNGNIFTQSTGGTGNLSYSWSNGNSSQDLVNVFSGLYSLTVTDQNSCSKILDFEILQPIEYYVNFNVANLNCFNENNGSINLDVSGNTPPYTFLWNTGDTTEDIQNLISGMYSVEVTDVNGCKELFETEVTEPEQIIIDVNVYNSSCLENNDGEIRSFVSGGTLPHNYLWSNGGVNSEIVELAKGTYSLQITDANNCQAFLDNIELEFEGYDGCIEIPSAFTPNSDGIHDEWAIYGLENFPDVVVNVFNRWGQLVFSSNGYNIPWDGKNNGVDLPTSTFYYTLELHDINKILNGTVTIKR